jgi:hypothetical protein
MSIKFSDHAVRQLKERKISRKQVIDTVGEPKVTSRSFKNRTLRQRQFGSKILEVVTVTEGSRITVVTAYYLKEEEYQLSKTP